MVDRIGSCGNGHSGRRAHQGARNGAAIAGIDRGRIRVVRQRGDGHSRMRGTDHGGRVHFHALDLKRFFVLLLVIRNRVIGQMDQAEPERHEDVQPQGEDQRQDRPAHIRRFGFDIGIGLTERFHGSSGKINCSSGISFSECSAIPAPDPPARPWHTLRKRVSSPAG